MSSKVPIVTDVVLDPTKIEPGVNQFSVSLRVSSPNEEVASVFCFLPHQRSGDGSVQFEGNLSLHKGDDPRNGRWSGEIYIPSNMPDGEYIVNCVTNRHAPSPGSYVNLSLETLGNITLGRTTAPDNVQPIVTSPVAEPIIIGGPTDVTSYISVSATVSDDVQVMLVHATGSLISRGIVRGYIFEPQDAPYMSFIEGVSKNGNGRWSGRLQG